MRLLRLLRQVSLFILTPRAEEEKEAPRPRNFLARSSAGQMDRQESSLSSPTRQARLKIHQAHQRLTAKTAAKLSSLIQPHTTFRYLVTRLSGYLFDRISTPGFTTNLNWGCLRPTNRRRLRPHRTAGVRALGYQLIMVGPNQERTVSRSLNLLELTHEWFQVKRQVVYRGRLTHRIQPIFPGYMFVLARCLWSIVESITGVRGFVRFGGRIWEVPDRVVEALRAQADARGILAREAALPFAPDDPIWVRLAGRETAARFCRYTSGTKCTVTVPLLGREVAATALIADCKIRG